MILSDAVGLLYALSKLHWARCLCALLVAQNMACLDAIVRICHSAIFSHMLHIVISAPVARLPLRELYRQRCFQPPVLLDRQALELCWHTM